MPLPPRGGPCSSGLIRPALLTQETGRRGPLSVPNRCPLSRFPRTCPALRACARRPRPDALFARTAGGRLVAEALSEVLPGPLCLAVQIRHSVLYRAVPRDPGWSLRPTRDGKGEPTVKMNFSCSTARSKANRGVKMYRTKLTSGGPLEPLKAPNTRYNPRKPRTTSKAASQAAHGIIVPAKKRRGACGQKGAEERREQALPPCPRATPSSPTAPRKFGLPGTKGPARPRTRLQPRVFHPLCARRARRAAVCEHTHAARGKCAENGTKGTCLGQRAGRGGRFLGSGAPGGSGQRSRGRLAVAAARHALFRARRGRQRRLCVFHSFTESSLLQVRLPANSQKSGQREEFVLWSLHLFWPATRH